MRTLSKFALGAVFSLAIPATAVAQRQGAIEIGALGRITKFADTLNLKTGFGLGGRAGIYVFRNVLAEMELSYADVDVDLPLTGNQGLDTLDRVSHAKWAYRLVYNAHLSPRAQIMIGGGYAYDSYGRVRRVAPRGGGPEALLGLRLVLNNRLSARFGATGQYVLPEDQEARPTPRTTHFNYGAQAGLSLSFFANPPAPRIQYDTIRVMQRDTIFVTRIDTVRAGNNLTGGTGTGANLRPVVIGAINFAFNRSDITNEAKLILDRIAESLVDPTNASRTITVTGNTDAIGSERYNERLGQDRADQAKAYLVSKGVAESRVTARTAGETDPVAPNTTDNGRATNRRVLIMLTN
jgi:outer membrane protein OmpA-like peptidoglycan-associated protein